MTPGHPKRLQEHGGPLQGHGEERPVCPLGRQREEVMHVVTLISAAASLPAAHLTLPLRPPVTFSMPCFLSTTSAGRRSFSKVSGACTPAVHGHMRCKPLSYFNRVLFVSVCFRGRGGQLLRRRPGRDGCKRRLFKKFQKII